MKQAYLYLGQQKNPRPFQAGFFFSRHLSFPKIADKIVSATIQEIPPVSIVVIANFDRPVPPPRFCGFSLLFPSRNNKECYRKK
jgi:hypothetical protein